MTSLLPTFMTNTEAKDSNLFEIMFEKAAVKTHTNLVIFSWKINRNIFFLG